MDPIMYTDDTNLFLRHKDISYLFETASLQLERISELFQIRANFLLVTSR